LQPLRISLAIVNIGCRDLVVSYRWRASKVELDQNVQRQISRLIVMRKETRYLYQYRSVSERSLKMLAEGKYYFAPAHSFNDPLDCAVEPINELPSIEKIIEHQAKVLQDNEAISFQEALQKSQIIKTLPQTQLEKLLQRLRDSIQNILRHEYGVLSLSAKNDNILMWSHYADYHRGFCIEFKRSPGNPLGSTQPVQYVKEYPRVNYFDDLPGGIAKRIILTKADDWSYEEEWRGIQNANTKVRYTDDMMTGIIFGLRMPNQHKRKIHQIFKGKKHMIFYQAELMPRKFKLAINQINKL
jgi:hypothetical protein